MEPVMWMIMMMMMMRWGNLEELIEGLIDEDERDEDGEDFLGEAGDESDQEAALQGHDDDDDHDQPHAHPDTAHDVLHALGLAELVMKKIDANNEKKCIQGKHFSYF